MTGTAETRTHAARITRHGQAPVVREVDLPVVGEGQVLVTVTAAPIVPLDLLCAGGTSYFGPPDLPYTPGVQGVGRLPDGIRVWFTTAAGMRPGDGALARHCVVSAASVLPVGEAVPDAVVAGLGLSAVAAAGALSRAGFAAGETVAVLGARGVVGQVAVQLARVRGAARVVAVQRGGGRAPGADAVVDAALAGPELAAALAVALPDGADVVVDPVWGPVAEVAATVLRNGGRLVNLGDSAGAAASFPSALLRSRRIDVRGYTNLSQTWAEQCAALLEVLELVEAGRLAVDVTTYPLADVERAWADHALQAPGRGRVVVVM